VSSADGPDSASLGEIIEVTWTVTNQGTPDTQLGWFDHIYFSDDTILDSGDTLADSYWAGGAFSAFQR
jgi:hypothetical protein